MVNSQENELLPRPSRGERPYCIDTDRVERMLRQDQLILRLLSSRGVGLTFKARSKDVWDGGFYALPIVMLS